MKFALLIIALVTNQGTLEMGVKKLEACPDKGAFTETMDKLKAEGKLVEWNAICIPPEGQDVKG